MNFKVVAIIGRPNVGKSTLFNRIIGRRLAVEHPRPGVTRDNHFAETNWADSSFLLVDTGGIDPDSSDDLMEKIGQRAFGAALASDRVVFLVDVKTGLTDWDREIAKSLKKSGRPVTLAVNKVDNPALQAEAAQFYGLGFPDLVPISAEHGLNIADLLEKVTEGFEPEPEETLTPDLSIAIVGRPNVGKSTLLNLLIGQEKVLTHHQPGTTRDAIDSYLQIGARTIRLFDTAGLMRPAKVTDEIVFYSALRTERAIRGSQVCLLLIDAAEGPVRQDTRIIDRVFELGRGLLVAANKWDLMKTGQVGWRRFSQSLIEFHPALAYTPRLRLSALNREGHKRVLSEVFRVAANHKRTIKTAALNRFLQDAVKKTPPPASKGRILKMNYITQTGNSPPRFIIFTNHPKAVKDNYRRYLLQRMRDSFDLSGIPIELKFRRK
ncbi:ribosome biogenesis GTPase Der [candidate division KSB1 bacterium]